MNMKTNETMTVNGSVVNEVLAFNTDAQVDEDTLRLIRLGNAIEGIENALEKEYVRKKMKQYKDKVFDLDVGEIEQEIEELEWKSEILTEEEKERLEELYDELDENFYGFSIYEDDWTIAAYVDDIPYNVFLMFAKEEFELWYNENGHKTFYIHNLDNFDETVFGVEDETIEFIKK